MRHLTSAGYSHPTQSLNIGQIPICFGAINPLVPNSENIQNYPFKLPLVVSRIFSHNKCATITSEVVQALCSAVAITSCCWWQWSEIMKWKYWLSTGVPSWLSLLFLWPVHCDQLAAMWHGQRLTTNVRFLVKCLTLSQQMFHSLLSFFSVWTFCCFYYFMAMTQKIRMCLSCTLISWSWYSGWRKPSYVHVNIVS